jgi:hypothetical protein
MKTTPFFFALGLLTSPAVAQLSPNPNAQRDIRAVQDYLTTLREDQPAYAYTAHGQVATDVGESCDAHEYFLPVRERNPRGFTNKRYQFEATQSVVAAGQYAGVWVGLRGTWSATADDGQTVRLPFRHLARLEGGRIVELHTARGTDGEAGGWWNEPLFGDGPVRLLPR